jgi:hypothetical protein
MTRRVPASAQVAQQFTGATGTASAVALIAAVAQVVVVQAGPPAKWTPSGITGGGAFFSPGFHPTDGNVITATTDMSGVFHSRDGGSTWATLPFGTIGGGRPAQVRFTSGAWRGWGVHTDSRSAAHGVPGHPQLVRRCCITCIFTMHALRRQMLLLQAAPPCSTHRTIACSQGKRPIKTFETFGHDIPSRSWQHHSPPPTDASKPR